jgi:cation diffusion facilitator family transporter
VAGSSKKVVYAAAAANLGIALCKYVAAAVTSSPSMLSEAVHSTVDTGNELLLLFGMKRSRRPPDTLHPFGHGKSLYFYSLLVAVYIFGIGGALAAYQGISRLRHPVQVDRLEWNYVVLAVAAIFESYSWRISYRELVARKAPDETLWSEIIGSKDPAIFTVFLEDSGALGGITLAFLGNLLDQLLNRNYFDPITSILIGVLLGVIAIFLGRESGALLIGERTNRSVITRIRSTIRSDESVEEVGDVLTMQLGPEQVLLAVNIKFREGLRVSELESAIDRLETRIREKAPTVKRIFIEADSLKKAAARRSPASQKLAKGRE